MNDADFVWIFHGDGARLAAAAFRSREAAHEWLVARGASGLLTAYPLNESAYEWAVRNGHFQPKNEAQRSPGFIQRFTSAAQEHEHYVEGRLQGGE